MKKFYILIFLIIISIIMIGCINNENKKNNNEVKTNYPLSIAVKVLDYKEKGMRDEIETDQGIELLLYDVYEVSRLNENEKIMVYAPAGLGNYSLLKKDSIYELKVDDNFWQELEKENSQIYLNDIKNWQEIK